MENHCTKMTLVINKDPKQMAFKHSAAHLPVGMHQRTKENPGASRIVYKFPKESCFFGQ